MTVQRSLFSGQQPVSDVVRTSLSQLGKAEKDIGEQLIFFCPFCVDRRGKEDTKGKLYFSKLKRVGFCFLCNAKVLAHEFTSEREANEWAATLMKSISLENDDSDETGGMPLLLKHWTVPVRSSEAYRGYLSGRGFTPETVDRFGFLGTKSAFGHGIVIPNKVERWRTDYLQVRLLSDDAPHKYDGFASIKKPLMYSHMVKKSSRYLALAEGCFSAVSIWQATGGKVDAVACLGKTLTEAQVIELQRIVGNSNIEDVFVVMDGGSWKETYTTAWRLKKSLYELPDEGVKLVNLPSGKDPNDLIGESLAEAVFESKSLERSNREKDARTIGSSR